MGISSSKSKSKTTNAPWAPAQPFIIKGLEQSSRVFDQQQPQLEQFAGMQRDTYGRVAPGAEEGILGAQDVTNANLRGDNLNGNPYLDAILSATRANTTNAVDGQFSKAGRYGSGSHAGILAKAIAEAENQARFNNYAMERGNQNAAVGQAQSLMGGSQSLLNNAAELPWLGVGALNGNVRQASNGYGTQTGTSTQSQAWGPMLLNAASQAAQAAAMSDPRVKTNVVYVSTDPDGLDWFDFDYRQDMGLELPKERQRGVMATDVAELRPWALGEPVGDFLTVDYSKLAMKEAA